MRYFKKIVGKKVYLSPLNIEDALEYTKWVNDLELSIKLSFDDQVITLEKERELIGKLSQGYNFAIVNLFRDNLIGNCGLHNLDLVNRTAELGIFIGEKQNRGQGYGTEALNLILAYGFQILNLHNIVLRVKEFNKIAIACYEKCGFQVIGRRRQACIFGQRKFDIIYMDILASEFQADSYLDLSAYMP